MIRLSFLVPGCVFISFVAFEARAATIRWVSPPGMGKSAMTKAYLDAFVSQRIGGISEDLADSADGEPIPSSVHGLLGIPKVVETPLAEPFGIVRLRLMQRMNVEQYLVYFFRSFPLAHLTLGSGDVFYLHGHLQIELSEIPEPIREALQNEIERALKGERKISGAWLDASRATYSFSWSHRRSPSQVGFVGCADSKLDQSPELVALRNAAPFFACAEELLGQYARDEEDCD